MRKLYLKITKESYCNIPFTDPTATWPCEPYYVYTSIEELSKYEVTERELETVTCCRSIGILWSEHAKFHMSDISSTGGIASNTKVQVSLNYLRWTSQTLMPCPVQIFGQIHWHARVPVIYVKIIQVLSVPQALRMKDAMNNLPICKPKDIIMNS